MTGLIPFGLPLIEAAAQGLIGPIIIRQRNIGGFVSDVTIKEDHEDELNVTENPVEQGANVTDHSFKAPARLTVEVGFSNSSTNAAGDPNYVQDQYANFLALQANRQPFQVITGKRIYQTMVITMLQTHTDEATENAMFLVVRMKEIIIVDTQTVSVPSSADMTSPQNTGASTSTGVQQGQFAGGAQGSAGNTTSAQFNFQGAPFSAGYGTVLENASH